MDVISNIRKVYRNLTDKYSFVFSELVKRDFKKKYKGTSLGMIWSMLSPLMQLLVMKLVFTQLFGKNTPHYTIYLLAGNIVISYYKESTKTGMKALRSNASIFSKIKIPKYLFVLSQNVSCLINFLLTVVIFFGFVLADGLGVRASYILLVFPTICLCAFNIGVGLILSAWQIFFKDITYLYDIFLTLLTYLSAVFYTVDRFPEQYQNLFLLNPVYVYIKYFRVIVIDRVIPSPMYHGLCLLYPAITLIIGGIIYKRQNNKFLYYI